MIFGAARYPCVEVIRPHNINSGRIDVMMGSPSKNRGEHEIFADFLRTAGDKHGFHLSNMNNHPPNIINSVRKRRY